MHTEEEAKKKWCPIRAKINASPVNAPAEGEIDNNCLGSGCIKWEGISILSMLNAIPYNDSDAGAIHRFIRKAREMVNEGVFKNIGRCVHKGRV